MDVLSETYKILYKILDGKLWRHQNNEMERRGIKGHSSWLACFWALKG